MRVFRFDVRASLARLSSAAGDVERMKRQARSESVLMTFYSCSLPVPTTVNDLTRQPDKASTGLLKDYCGWLLTRFLPVPVKGDGNCLFRAISYAMYGSEEHYLLLRLLAAIEALSCQDFYDIASNSLYAPFRVEINGALMLAPYDQFVTELSHDGSFSDMLAVLAASSVLQKPIQTFWPIAVTPGEQSPLTKLLMGRGVVSSKHPLHILWTTSDYRGLGSEIIINHFVPLLENDSVESVQIDSAGEDTLSAQSGGGGELALRIFY